MSDVDGGVLFSYNTDIINLNNNIKMQGYTEWYSVISCTPRNYYSYDAVLCNIILTVKLKLFIYNA